MRRLHRSWCRRLHDGNGHLEGLLDRTSVDDRQRHDSDFGGQAYFNNEPYERMMRDARINTIGEGANEVLKAFIAVVGCRGPGMRLG